MSSITIQSDLLVRLSTISDPRLERSKLYPLHEILFLTLNAVLSGYSDWEEIADFGEEKLEWLRKYSPYTNGVPAHDTINRVMGLISPKEFEAFFVDWARGLAPSLSGKVVNIDGKSLKGSVNNSLKNVKKSEGGKQSVHLVEAWCSELGLCLGQVKTEEKSNEITAIPELLSMLDLEGSVVTIDAMGCQKDIAAKIAGGKGQYLLGLKGNQEGVFEAVKALFAARGGDAMPHETSNIGHGRIEARSCKVLPASLLAKEHLDGWPELRTLVEIEAHRGQVLRENDFSLETRYYLSSMDEDASYHNTVVRGHWAIENELHWRMDVTFGEDASRKQQRNAPQNFGVINRVALNLLKNNGEKPKVSIKRRMNKCAMNDDYRWNTILF